LDERFAVYTTIVFVCSAIGALAGLPVALVTFCLMSTGVEVTYWLAGVLKAPGRLSAE
jgi:hypothetical protein